MIEAIIFDMDGILVNSEPFWQEAEKEIFSKLGIEITPEMAKLTYGMPTTELINYYYQLKPWDNFDPGQIKYEIFDRAENLIEGEGQAMDGAYDILNFFREKQLKIALASASPTGIIETVLKKLNIKNYFNLCQS